MRAVSKTCPITEALVRASFQPGASFRAIVLWIVLRSLLRVSTGLHGPDSQAAGVQQCGNEWGERSAAMANFRCHSLLVVEQM